MVFPSRAGHLEAGQVVRRLKAGGHHQDVDGVLGAGGVYHPVARHRGDSPGDQAHIVTLECAIERGIQDWSLARIG